MKILESEELSKYTSYKIGGKTPKMYIIKYASDLYSDDISGEDIENAYILGGGTNILINSDGINKPVIKIEIDKFNIYPLYKIVKIGAGIKLNEAAKLLVNLGINTLIGVSGIPGTIGGAIVMNASASHGSISDNIISVDVFNKIDKKLETIKKEDCNFDFRNSIFKSNKYIILEATFSYEISDQQILVGLYNEINKYREENYPSLPSAGCIFKRDWGGKEIIKQINMIGVWHGGAVVSPMFPAFILNANKATSNDVLFLIEDIQKKAKLNNEEMPLEIDTWCI